MFNNIKNIQKLSILTFALVLFSISTNAQEVRVIDNKGTRQTVKSNLVNVSTNASQSTPTTFTFPSGYTPLENDTFIYKPTIGEKVYYIYDGTEWNMIAPTKASRIFYPPSIAIDASTIGTNRTIDLYDQYTTQFTSPMVVSAGGAPSAIPTYAKTELYYYVTYYDPTVFENVSIDANGIMTYDIKASPADYNSLINVVFVVK